MSLRTFSLLGVSLAVLFAGCSDDAPSQKPEDYSKEPTAPEPCELVASPTPFCTPVQSSTGSSTGSGGAGGAAAGPGGAAGMGGQAAPPIETATPGCLIDQDVTLRCPSVVGMLSMARGPQQSVDVLFAQQGLAALNAQGSVSTEQLAYVAALRFDGSELERKDALIEPFTVVSPPDRSLGLVPGAEGSDTLLVQHQSTGESSSELRVGPLFASEPESKSLSLTTPLRFGSGLRTSTGEGLFVESNAFEGITVFRDLPDAPRMFSLPAADALAVTSNGAGELRALVHDRMNLSILEGEDLAQTGFSMPVDTGVNMPEVDLVYVGEGSAEHPVVLYRNGSTDQLQVLFIDGAGQASAPAFLGRYTNDCDTFYIGLTCDECPEGKTCQSRQDQVIDAKLFAHEGRVFVAYVATDHIEHAVIDKEETGFGLGCSCTPDETSTEDAAELLVVLEVQSPESGAAPKTVELMRQVVAPARGVEYLRMSRGPNGTLDVVLGPSLARFDAPLMEFPENPSEFRILRVDPSASAR